MSDEHYHTKLHSYRVINRLRKKNTPLTPSAPLYDCVAVVCSDIEVMNLFRLLADNKFETLPIGAFEGLTSLREL